MGVASCVDGTTCAWITLSLRRCTKNDALRMFILMAVVFVLGYLAIALEHPLRVNKAASGRTFTGAVVWTILMLGQHSILPEGEAHGHEGLIRHLLEHLGDIAGVLFFLMGAMTIVKIIDVHEGFRVIADRISSTKKTNLLWVVGLITFFLSAALDNLTTAIVMCALLKLIKDKETLWLFAGVVVIAANAGGAWSPIGDVTTIMLWVGGQVTTVNIMLKLIAPSLVAMIFPLVWFSFTMKGNVERPDTIRPSGHHGGNVTTGERNLVFM